MSKEMTISLPKGTDFMQFAAMLVACGLTYGVLSTKVDALEDDEKETNKKIEVLTTKVNDQAVTIGQIVVTTKSIENQMSTQQRLLEKISAQLMASSPQ